MYYPKTQILKRKTMKRVSSTNDGQKLSYFIYFSFIWSTILYLFWRISPTLPVFVG